MKYALGVLGWLPFSLGVGALGVAALATGCTVVEDPTFVGGEAVGGEEAAAIGGSDSVTLAANEPLPPDAEGCPGLYAQDLLPEFHLTISEAVMSTLYEDWVHGRERNSLDDDDTPYHPVSEFRYGDIAVQNAMIRLRGNPNFWLEQNKMQFQVSFDEINKNGRFMGQRKMLFDAATFNRHFMRDRLSLWIFRQAGVPAPCANNARLYINDEYYGLFTSIEKLDNVFLKRVFPNNDHGDLFERRGYEQKTNEDTSDDTRLDQMRTYADAFPSSTNPDAGDGLNPNLEGLAAYMDFEQVLRLYAVDAILPNSDGPWAGGLNYYFYDHPGQNKFFILPWDLDNTFTRLTPDVQPYTYSKPSPYHGRPYFNAILSDDVWLDRYVEIIEEVVNEIYNTDTLWALTGTNATIPLENLSDQDRQLLGVWSGQIRDSAFADINKPYTNRRMEDRRAFFANFLAERETCLRQWLECVHGSDTTRQGVETCVCDVDLLSE
ncbi:CotH kinase family protein [Haliangium ochraceum]|uniref:Spore coat protein CotH n=1 Tax=Haliangium ochraceum (strain DSM 14365 / JCM 11303 / SMP-2) TaxID=502025 RepID=D0LFP1_HALO1|nr:CotH kinase family protein [Haliangium ochraceum]ACY12675.1 Spore coat protein CotH [Haliangium ochraceum DSM 14365]